MTAFATTTAQKNNISLCWELRTVNHRFLDISVRLPGNFRPLETEIRQLISKHIRRGKAECTLTVQEDPHSQQSIQLNTTHINQIIAATKQITALQPSVSPPNVLEILSWPGVQEHSQPESKTLKPLMMDTLNSTLQQLVEMRQREGQQLSGLLENKCNAIHQQTTLARQRIPHVLQETRKRIIEKIVALQLEPDMDRLEQELVYLTQKMDITEELDRIETHVTEIQKTLKQTQPIGRRLDFLMQELNREANTIGSKSADIIISQVSVELKVFIEQMREQVQNLV